MLLAALVSCNAWNGIDEQVSLDDGTAVNSKVNNFAGTFRFILDIERIKTTPTNTPAILLNGVAWTVSFKYKNNNVDIHLVPNFVNNSADAIEVEASYKLFERIDRTDKTFAKFLSKRQMKNSETAIIQKFVNWNDFFTNYVYKRLATFEIEIKTNPVNPKFLKPGEEIDVTSAKSIIELNHLNASNLNTSSEMVLRGIKWNIYTEKKNESLSVYVQADEKSLDQRTLRVDATFALLSFKTNVDPIKYTFSHTFRIGSSKLGIDHFVSLTELFNPNKELVLNGKANLFVEIHVDEPKQLWKF